MASSLVLFLVSLLMATISMTTCSPQELNRDANSDPTDRPSGSTGRPETAEMSGGLWRSIQAEMVHKDHPLRAAPGSLSFKERAERDFQSSRRRLEVLRSRHERWLAGGGGGGGGLPTYVSNLTTSVNEAEYVMQISVGTPAQNFLAIVDTGSDLTWLQCQPCAHCFPQADPLYDPSRSSSHANLTCPDSACQRFTSQNPGFSNCPLQSSSNASCNYVYVYGDGSNTTGNLVVDTIHLTSTDGAVVDVPNFAFGCSQSSFSGSVLFSSNTDGIVGLGHGDISFPSQLGASFGNIFSYCLVPATAVATQTSPLLFGSAALSNATGIQYTPMLSGSTPSFDYVGLQAITVAGEPLEIPSSVFANNGTHGGTFFDSGTTFTHLEPQALDALVIALAAAIPFPQIPSTISGSDHCWNSSGLTDADIAARVPTVSFNFTGANYDLSYDNTFLTFDPFICLAIARGMLGFPSIIGSHQQRNMYLVYDRANSQIGFVPRNCSDSVSV